MIQLVRQLNQRRRKKRTTSWQRTTHTIAPFLSWNVHQTSSLKRLISDIMYFLLFIRNPIRDEIVRSFSSMCTSHVYVYTFRQIYAQIWFIILMATRDFYLSRRLDLYECFTNSVTYKFSYKKVSMQVIIQLCRAVYALTQCRKSAWKFVAGGSF